MDRKFRPEAFVEFLNDDCGGFRLDDIFCNRLRSFLGMSDKYRVLYDCMVGEKFIERCADIWHSVGLVKMGDERERVYYGEELMKIDILRDVGLANGKVINPQRFFLRRLFREGNEAVGLNYIKGERQLDYENGFWKFAD